MAQPKIFVSHSHKDDTFTERLVTNLRQAGANAWMDKTDMDAGAFQQRINEALTDCEWFVLVLTREALASSWVQQEVYAANRLRHQGRIRNLIFIQAGPIDHGELPPTWGVFNIFDATADYASACDRTLRAVGLAPLARPVTPQTAISTQIVAPPPEQFSKRLADLGFSVRSDHSVDVIVPPLCAVSAGPFLMGSDPKRDKRARKDEQPQHSVTLPAYDIARFPVTVAEYELFLRAGHGEPKYWALYRDKVNHPVIYVSWHDALAYAVWLTECTGEAWRLPTEAEWEKAARGAEGRIYPWGDTFDEMRCNTSESGIEGTTPVGRYPNSASPYGLQDMAGNIWEWASSWRLPYRQPIFGRRQEGHSSGERVQRGGSWRNDARGVRAAHRNYDSPGYTSDDIGFRLVRAVPNS